MQSLCNQSVTPNMSWLVGRVAGIMINACRGVGEAIPEVESSRMPALAESAIIIGGGIGERIVRGNGVDWLQVQELVRALDANLAEARLNKAN
jgi:hypothetical protein